MTTIGRWLHNRWTVATASGLLILGSLIASRGFDAGTVGDALMIAAAVVAGTPSSSPRSAPSRPGHLASTCWCRSPPSAP